MVLVQIRWLQTSCKLSLFYAKSSQSKEVQMFLVLLLSEQKQCDIMSIIFTNCHILFNPPQMISMWDVIRKNIEIMDSLQKKK